MRLVLAKHGDGVGAVQLRDRGLHGLKQVGVIQTVHQMGNCLGVGLADEHIALCLERCTQLVMVFNDAVVHQRNATGPLVCIRARAVAEMGMRIADRWHAMRGPARVGNAQMAQQWLLCVISGNLLNQLRHTGRAASAAQASVLGTIALHIDGYST